MEVYIFRDTAVHHATSSYSVGEICGSLRPPSNGGVNTSAGIFFEDTAVYSCDMGYMLSGPAERTCQAGGQWSGSEPTCESEWVTL